ncbi:zinc-ribbon domain-containing protein [Alphaproteobacteria bacterium]|nr:zinc-ribbon domain-containing protein [Alphaproteobacteria bacterium]
MLISCTSCNSKYLVNSADLKPDGRTVECANCGNQWYQESTLSEEEILTLSTPSTSKTEDILEKKKPIPNLPSTVVKDQKVSAINSILVLLFLIILVLGFWIVRNLDLNSFVLFKFYIDEFYFNLKLIISDIAKIIHKIINSI